MSVSTKTTPVAPRNTRSSAMPSVARKPCSQRVVGVASEADSSWKNGITDTSPATVVAAMTSARPRSARQRRRSCGGSNTQNARTVFMRGGIDIMRHGVLRARSDRRAPHRAPARTMRAPGATATHACAAPARASPRHNSAAIPRRAAAPRQNEIRLEEARAITRRGVVDSQTAPLASGAAESAKRATTVTAQQIPTHFPGDEAAHDHPDERRIRCEPRRQYACERREVRRTVHGAEI